MRLPKVVSFDAFNTLFVPRKPILKLYSEVASRHGIDVPEAHLKKQLPIIMKEMKQNYPNYGKRSSMRYTDWWATLIANTYAPTEISKEFAEDLVEVFSSNEAYGTYTDVVKFFQQYGNRKDIIFVAASNGDPRVASVLESLGLAKYFQKVYLSYDIDLLKPDTEFFNYIIDDLRGPFTPREEMLKNAYHIGDEFNNDLEGAVNAGWNGVLVDRTKSFDELKKSLAAKGDEVDIEMIKLQTDLTNTSATAGDEETAVRLDDKRSVISSFSKLPEIVGLL